MITIRCICTDKAQMRILRFSYLLQEKSCSKWGMVRLHSSFFRAENAQIIILFLKYQGKVLQEEREDKKHEYDCFNG